MKRRYPDGPRITFPLVVIGQLFPKRFPFDPLAFHLAIARKYGDLAYFRIGPLRVYAVNHPDLLHQILVEQAQKFYKPRLLKLGSRRILGDGLLTSDGALWKQQRSLIQPAFRHDQLSVYGDVMVGETLRVADSLRDGEISEIDTEMSRLTTAIVVKALFGEDIPPEAEDLRETILAVADAASRRLSSVIQPPAWVPTRRNLRERRAIVRLNEIIQRLILTRRTSEAHRPTGPLCAERETGRADVLSVLLAAVDADTGVRISDQQLRDEIMTLFLAGQDTTANALTWTWYLLAQHPEVEAKLQEELKCVLAGRAPAIPDLPRLAYTGMIIQEAMRLYPPAPQFAREPIEDVIIGGFEVPKGSLITVSTYALHRDPRFFPDPERFDPDRFAPSWEARIPRYAYLPFGGGPRTCIGNGFAMMEARLILATLAQRWKFSLEPWAEIAPKQLVTLRTNRPVRMRVRRARLSVDVSREAQ